MASRRNLFRTFSASLSLNAQTFFTSRPRATLLTVSTGLQSVYGQTWLPSEKGTVRWRMGPACRCTGRVLLMLGRVKPCPHYQTEPSVIPCAELNLQLAGVTGQRHTCIHLYSRFNWLITSLKGKSVHSVVVTVTSPGYFFM